MSEKHKPKCALIGEDGNIFNLMGIASRTLKRNGMQEEAKEMCDKITNSESYDQALAIISDYVEVEKKLRKKTKNLNKIMEIWSSLIDYSIF